jgi:hypothetical protein
MYKANPVRPAQSKGAWLELEAWPADGGYLGSLVDFPVSSLDYLSRMIYII